MFGAYGAARQASSMTFMSQQAKADGVAEALGLKNLQAAVTNCRDITKADMIHNDWQPDISVDPETYEVIADGEALTCEPASRLPLTQLYQLF